MKQEHPECPYCTCGQIELTWSDRVAYALHNDPEGIAEKVVNCALDHSYDRTKTGVPYGLNDQLRVRLAFIVDRHLSSIQPEWNVKDLSVYMNDEQREAFELELAEEIKRVK